MQHLPRIGEKICISQGVDVIVRDVLYDLNGKSQIIADFQDSILCGYQMEELGFSFWSFKARERINQHIVTPVDAQLGFIPPS